MAKGKPIPSTSSLVRLGPFLDDKGLLRITGRLQHSHLTYNQKHPLILPKGRVATLLIRAQHVSMNHAGYETVITELRNKFHIISGRRIAKGVTKVCIACQVQDKRPCNQPAPPLPEDRVTRASPFAIVGLDHAGPIFVKDNDSKLYFVLYTCMSTRAIHLELCDSLNLYDFLLSFRRFASRRGLPEMLYSDNAKTFRAGPNEMLRLYGDAAPRWRFIAARAPWWGGAWERLIRSVKSCLRRTIGRHRLVRKELETLLVEVENTVAHDTFHASRALTSEPTVSVARMSQIFCFGSREVYSCG